MTNTTLPRITGAAPAGLLLAPEGRLVAPNPVRPAGGSSWGVLRPAAHSPAPHVDRPEPTPLDESAWQELERMLAERERCRRAHPARGAKR